jgi:hypothetical protein
MSENYANLLFFGSEAVRLAVINVVRNMTAEDADFDEAMESFIQAVRDDLSL